MHVVSRVLYWLSLSGLGLSLVAPLVFGGASWSEAQVGVVVGLLLTFAFGVASVATAKGSDPVQLGKARRRGALSYGIIGAVTMGALGTVAFVEASRAADATVEWSLPTYEQSYRFSMIEDAGKGTYSGLFGIVGAGLSLFAALVFAGRKAGQPMLQPTPSYHPHAHLLATYGPKPAPWPQPWHEGGQARGA